MSLAGRTAVDAFVFLNQNHLLLTAFNHLAAFAIAPCEAITMLFAIIVEVDILRILLVHGLQKRRTGKEIEARLSELFADLVVVVSALHICIKSTGSSMVDGYGGADTYVVTAIFEDARNRLRGVAIGIQAKGAVVRFFS